MIRRGTSYGPLLPEGVLEDDGADRGLMFVFIGANLTKQFEFVQSTWINDGEFIGANTQTDPICGTNDLSADMTIPRRPIRQRIQGLPRFVVTRGEVLLHARAPSAALAGGPGNLRGSAKNISSIWASRSMPTSP